MTDGMRSAKSLAELARGARYGGSALVGYLATGDGAVHRTVQSTLSERLSVKDFGAAGDGVTDDTVAVRNACTAARAAKVALHIPAGVYLVSSTLDLQDIHVIGEGFAIDPGVRASTSTIIRSTANPIITVSPYPGTVIENIAVYGLGTAASVETWEVASYAGQIGMWLGRTSGVMTISDDGDTYGSGGSGGVYLRGVSFGGSLGWGIYAYKLWGQSTIENCVFYHIGNKVGADGDHYGGLCFAGESVDIDVTNCHFLGSTAGGGTAIKVGASKTETDALDRFYSGPGNLRFTNVFIEGSWDYALNQYHGINTTYTACMFGGDSKAIRIGESTPVAWDNNTTAFIGCGTYAATPPYAITCEARHISFHHLKAQRATDITYYFDGLSYTGPTYNVVFVPSGNKAAITYTEEAYYNMPVITTTEAHSTENLVPDFDAAWTTTAGATKVDADTYQLDWSGATHGHIYTDLTGLVAGEVYTVGYYIVATQQVVGTGVQYYVYDSTGAADVHRNNLGSTGNIAAGTKCYRLLQFIAPAGGAVRVGIQHYGTGNEALVTVYRPVLYRGMAHSITMAYPTAGISAWIRPYKNE